MPRTRSKILLCALSAALLWSIPAMAADPRAEAVRAVKTRATGCGGCYFFALPTSNPLIRKHSLFFVSTLDRVPPPFSTVAVPNGGAPILLDPKRVTGWNRMIAEENPPLKKKEDFEAYVKAFVELAIGRAQFVSELLPGELLKVQKKAKGATKKSLQVVRGKELISVSFYAKDPLGVLQLWDLTVEPNGTIDKSEVQEF